MEAAVEELLEREIPCAFGDRQAFSRCGNTCGEVCTDGREFLAELRGV